MDDFWDRAGVGAALSLSQPCSLSGSSGSEAASWAWEYGSSFPPIDHSLISVCDKHRTEQKRSVGVGPVWLSAPGSPEGSSFTLQLKNVHQISPTSFPRTSRLLNMTLNWAVVVNALIPTGLFLKHEKNQTSPPLL